MMAPRFKLPAQVLAAHQAALEAWDWQRRPEMPLAVLMPEAGFAEGDVLEAVGRGNHTVVRSKSPGAARRMRAYAERMA